MLLVDTERCPQQPLDKAASCVLTDRSLPHERASWQQCACCDEWIQETNLEYTFQCALGLTPGGSPTINFELKTRYPAYTCPSCYKKPSQPPRASTTGNQDSEDDEEAEQLCPLHVQAVYLLRGSKTANNMDAVTKGFILHCPDCGLESQLFNTPSQVKSFIQQHVSASRRCSKLQRALASGTYDSAASFGAAKHSSSVEPEKVIKELYSRLVVMIACHVVSCTRPPPTPIEQLTGDARRTAAATAQLRSTSKDQSTSEGQQLMPYRSWAVDALSLDSDLLSEANWVRPSLAGMALEHKPSLLDMVLAPPYIAVAEHDAGMTVDKLAVLLLRQQRRQKGTSFALLMAAAAAGEQLPEAVAAVEAALIDLLSTDAVLQRFPKQQRLELFLEMAGIPGLSDVVYALAQPQVQGRNPHRIYLNVCAVCGMSPMALKRAKRPSALHRCKYCIICTCQSCKHEQEQQQPDGPSAASHHLCLWCQGHPDTQGLVLPEAGSSKPVSGSSKVRSGQYYTSSPEGSADDQEDLTAGFWGDESGLDAGLDSQDSDWQQQQRKGKSKKKKESKGQVNAPAGTAAATAALPSPHAVGAGCDVDDDMDRAADGSIYDLVVSLATAAAAGGGGGGGGRPGDVAGKQNGAAAAAAAPTDVSPVKPEVQRKPSTTTTTTLLDKEMEDLRRMQLELQQAAERLGLQGISLPALDQQQQQPADGSMGKRKLSPDTADRRDSDTRPDKRHCQQQQQQQAWSPPAASDVGAKPPLPPAAAAALEGYLKRRRSTLSSSASPSPPPAAFTVAAAEAAGGGFIFSKSSSKAVKCGNCDTCRNPHWNKACLTFRKQHEPAIGSRVMKCGKCKTCLNPQHKKACLVYHVGKQVKGKQQSEGDKAKKQPTAQIKQQQEATEEPDSAADEATETALLADLLLSSAGFQPISSSSNGSTAAGKLTAAAVDHVECAADTAAALAAAGESAAKVQQELSQMLATVGFGSKDADVKAADNQGTAAAATPVGDGPVEGVAAVDTTTAAAGEAAAAASASALISALHQDVNELQQGISSWCKDNLAGQHSDVTKAMQVIQQLQQQLTDSYEETKEQLFLTGLQVLQQVVRTFQQLPDAGCQVLLACNTQGVVPASCCPDDQPCSVLELLMCCWFKEVQDTGLSVAEGHVAAAKAMTGAAADRKQIVAGLCCQTIDVMGKLTAAQHGWSCGVTADDSSSDKTHGRKLMADSRQAVVQLMAGASMLLMQWPEEADDAGGDGSSNSASWVKFAARWWKCLSRCWCLLGDKNDAAAVESACKDISDSFKRLLKAVGIEAE